MSQYYINAGGSSGGGLLLNNTVTLSSTDIKALTTVPFILIPAQGSGTIIVPYTQTYKLIYGTSPFDNNVQMQIAFFDGASFFSAQGVIPNNFFTQTQNTYAQVIWGGISGTGGSSIAADVEYENLPLVLTNPNAAITGNAGNDTMLKIATQYVILTL